MNNNNNNIDVIYKNNSNVIKMCKVSSKFENE